MCLPPPLTSLKLQLNYKPITLENCLKTNLCNFCKYIKKMSHETGSRQRCKKAHLILKCGGLESGGISQLLKQPLRSEGSKSHTGLLSSEQHYWKEESTQHLVVKIIRDSVQVSQRAVVDPSVLLNDPSTDSLNHKHFPMLQQRDNSLRNTRDIWGGTESSGFKERARVG